MGSLSHGELKTDGLQAVDVDLPIDEAPPFLDEVRQAVARLRCRGAADV